jgi:hypothetical protein
VNGCSFATAVGTTVVALNPPTDLTFVVTTAPTCPANTATVQVTATSGLGALDFDVISFNGTPTALYPTVTVEVLHQQVLGLPPGDYMFQVTDANGCTELFIVSDVTPAIVGALVNDISVMLLMELQIMVRLVYCNRFAVLEIILLQLHLCSSNRSQKWVIYYFNRIVQEHTLSLLQIILHYVATDDVIITEPAPITFTTAATKVFCSQDISQITVSNVGGTGAYTYAVTGSATAPLAERVW